MLEFPQNMLSIIFKLDIILPTKLYFGAFFIFKKIDFKVFNSRNNRLRYQLYSKLTIKKLEWSQ